MNVPLKTNYSYRELTAGKPLKSFSLASGRPLMDVKPVQSSNLAAGRRQRGIGIDLIVMCDNLFTRTTGQKSRQPVRLGISTRRSFICRIGSAQPNRHLRGDTGQSAARQGAGSGPSQPSRSRNGHDAEEDHRDADDASQRQQLAEQDGRGHCGKHQGKPDRYRVSDR